MTERAGEAADARSYRELYLEAPCGLLTTRADGTIIEVNDSFVDWTGRPRDRLLAGVKFSELLTGGGRIYHETHYAPLLHMHGSAREIAFDIVCADGNRLPVLVNAVAHRDGDEVVDAIDVAVFSAADRREYERELLAAKRRSETAEGRARALAQTLQRTLIPPSLPRAPGLDIAAAYRPAGDGDEIGGDFYDVFQIGPFDWMIAVGDVQGKGVDAAIVTATARHTIRAAAVEHDNPSAVLQVLNDVLIRDESERFCTVTVIRCRKVDGDWRLTTSCAGHPPPILVRAGELAVEIGRPGTLAGVIEDVDLYDTHAILRPGDTVVAFTDGVIEARRDGEFFGDPRLRRYIEEVSRDGTVADVASSLLDHVMQFQDQYARDDIAVIALRLELPTDLRPGG